MGGDDGWLEGLELQDELQLFFPEAGLGLVLNDFLALVKNEKAMRIVVVN